MSLSKKIAFNTIIHSLGKISAAVISLVIVILMTRYLGAQGFGNFTTIFAYLYFFSILGDLGLYLATLNELGRENIDKQKIYSNAFTMRFFSALILMLLAISLIWFFPYSQIVKIGVLIVSILIFIQMVDQLLVVLFQEKMQTKYTAWAEFVGRILILILIFLSIKFDKGFLFILWSFVAGYVLHFLIDLFFAKKLLSFSFKFDKQIWKNLFSKSWPIATYMVFSMLYFKADTLILSLYHPASTVGIYGAPYKILEFLIVLPAIFMGLVIPHLSKAWSQKNLIDFKNIFQKAFDALSIITWPLIFGTVILAKPIINLIAGKEFFASTPILQILIFATGIIFLAHLTTFSVVAIEKQKAMMKYYIIAAISALILYFIFIPIYSYWAAAIITVLVELFILISSALMIKKSTQIKISFKNNLKSFFSAIIMTLAIYLTSLSLFASILLGIVIYTGGLLIFKVLNKNLILEFIKK